jgi:hypothetical protein
MVESDKRNAQQSAGRFRKGVPSFSQCLRHEFERYTHLGGFNDFLSSEKYIEFLNG